MTDIKSLLLLIAQENGISEARVLPVVEKLHEEWYDTVESLREMTDSQWVSLGIPGRLVELIKKKLHGEKKIDPNLDFLVENLNSADNKSVRPCLETITTLLGNIIKSEDPKFRKINKSNQNFYNKVGRFASAVQYLVSLGFEDSSESLLLRRESKAILHSELSKIQALLESIPSSNFDPQVASFTSTNFEAPKIKSRENDPIAITEQIASIKNQEFPRVERNPQVFKIENTNVQSYFRDVDSQGNSEKDDQMAQLANIQTVMRQREEFSSFRNKRKNELSRIKETVLFKVVIRIRFPDKLVLQGEFSIKETTGDLYRFVRERLVQEGREFYLYEIPLRKPIKDGRHDLSPFGPASILYFAWNGVEETTEAHGPFLSN